MCRGRRRHQRGFTLVEMIISIGLFSIVMLISVGALLVLVTANRKAQATQSVMNNLNIALDAMVRSIREGSNYHCGSGDATAAKDCDSNVGVDGGDTIFAFKPFSAASASQRWIYSYSGGRIYKQEDVNATPIPITAQEVLIDSMRFYVVGTTQGDQYQPKVLIVIKGTVGAKADAKVRSTFNIQATAVQRILDL